MEPQHGPVGLRDGARPDVVSAFSVDVEDYFHVEAFRGVVDPADWASMEQRVEPNTRRLLDLLDAHGVRATFFVLGWVGERSPGSSVTSTQPGTRSGSTATITGRSR